MTTINYSAKVLPNGHLSLPEERERAIKAFGAWSEKNDIEDGVDYVSRIRKEWNERIEMINDA